MRLLKKLFVRGNWHIRLFNRPLIQLNEGGMPVLVIMCDLFYMRLWNLRLVFGRGAKNEFKGLVNVRKWREKHGI